MMLSAIMLSVVVLAVAPSDRTQTRRIRRV